MQAPNPVAFTLFGLDVRWYGLLIGLGFFLAILLCYKRAPKHGIESEHILDFAIWLIPMSIIGARAYYVLFSWDNYAGDIGKILDIRSGGLAIHGGIIAGIITGYFVGRHYKINFLELADLFLIWLDRHRRFPGQIAFLYGMLYSLERFFVEQLRTDSLMIGPLKQAQVLSFCVFAVCLAAYIIQMKKEKRSI